MVSSNFCGLVNSQGNETRPPDIARSIERLLLLTASFSSPPLSCCSILQSFLLFLFSVLFILTVGTVLARRIAPLHPLFCAVSSILSVTSLSWLAQRVRSAAVVFRDTSAPNWNAWLAVAVCWLAIPPMSLLRPAIPDSEPGYTSCADSTSGKPVVTSCQSTFLHEQPPVSPWKQ